MDLKQWAQVVDPVTETGGLFCGWTDSGKALIWWDGVDGAEEENPDEVEVAP